MSVGADSLYIAGMSLYKNCIMVLKFDFQLYLQSKTVRWTVWSLNFGATIKPTQTW